MILYYLTIIINQYDLDKNFHSMSTHVKKKREKSDFNRFFVDEKSIKMRRF